MSEESRLLVYHGKIPEVHEELGKYREAIHDALRSILGEEIHSGLEKTAERLLVPEAFEISQAAMQRGDSICEVVSDEKRPRFSIQGDGRVRCDPPGPLKLHPRVVVNGPGIAFRKQKLPSLDKYGIGSLDTYLHELMHFSCYTYLQPVPFKNAFRIISNELRKDHNPQNLENQRYVAMATQRFPNLRTSVLMGDILYYFDEIDATALQAEVYRRIGVPDAWNVAMHHMYNQPVFAQRCEALRRGLEEGDVSEIRDWDLKTSTSDWYIRPDVKEMLNHSFSENFFRSLRGAVELEWSPITDYTGND